jgi:dihydroorotate dehydrogenase
MYKRFIRPILFLLPPETIHHLVVVMLKVGFTIPGVRRLVAWAYRYNHPSLRRNVFGLEFKNPVGFAAGFDKNAEVFNDFTAFGFSFIEIGTVTPRPQPGNPKPRSFRLKADNALINRMGFNNKGVHFAARSISRQGKHVIVGGNIGKNTDTPNESAVNDYLYCFRELYDYVDYLVVNISCPNVANLRHLQDGEQLRNILEVLLSDRKRMPVYKPVLLKVSPDLSFEQIDETIKIAEAAGIDGYIATNTTTNRANLITPSPRVAAIGNGGLSGAPLTARSTEILKYLHQKTNGKKPIIGVGGIMNVHDALEKLEAGATLIQLYTGFIYSGPGLVKRINKAIVSELFSTTNTNSSLTETQ